MGAKKILIIDDDPHIIKILQDYLKFEDFKVRVAENTRRGYSILEKEVIDLLLLDILLPNENGLEFCQRIKNEFDLAIIFLSAKTNAQDKIAGLELGADDYIGKPFSPQEVIARIKAVLRRYDSEQGDQNCLEYGALIINKQEHYLKYKGENIDLTPKEFALLWHLAQNPKKVFRRKNLLKAVWGYDYFGDVRTVDTHIKSLRKKLGEAAAVIETVWGVGYKFEAQAL